MHQTVIADLRRQRLDDPFVRRNRLHFPASSQAGAAGYYSLTEGILRTVRLLGLPALLAVAAHCWGFESDVHYGITQWLALKAGFNEREAATIATGNQRVDSGDMQYTDVGLLYACLGKDDVSARRAGADHYPSAGTLPGAPETRAVSPGSDVAMKAAAAMLKVEPAKAGFMLLKLGEALHILQESWAHQGIPDIAYGGRTGIECDATRAWGHPKARGGADSHKADLVRHWPADTIAAAKATYDVLTRFAPVDGAKRKPQSWDAIRPRLDTFIKASTKSRKRAWFNAEGITDVAFLEGISLPDGDRAFDSRWQGRRQPPLPTDQSRQHYVDPTLLDFYHAFFERWMTARDFNALAAQFGPPAGPRRDELVARLKVWRIRDHGRVADLAHVARPLSDAERARVDQIAGARNAFPKYANVRDAYFPLLPNIEGVSPLLPFFIAETSKDRVALAAVKFRHTPYDAVAVRAIKTARGWRIDSIVGTVDH